MDSGRLAVVLALTVSAAAVAQGERAPEQFQVALGMQQRGLHEEAARYFAAFVRASPDHPLIAEAQYRIGVCRLELGETEPAVAALRAALAAAGVDWSLMPECRYRLGTTLKETGKPKEAQAQFAALRAAVPAEHYLAAPASYAEGECWRDQKNDAQALACFRVAIERSVGDQASFLFPSLYQAGFAQLRLGQFEVAGESFTAAAAKAPDEAAAGECHYLTGDAALRRKDWPAAEAAFARALERTSEFVDDARFGSAWAAVGRGDDGAALQRFQAVLERHADSPFVPRAQLETARLLYKKKQFDEAHRLLAPLAASSDPELQKQARELQGLCALELGDSSAAVQALQEARASAAPAEQPRLSFALGEALANEQRWAEAVAAYDAVGDTADEDLRGDALYGACFALHRLGRYDESTQRAMRLRTQLQKHRLIAQATFAVAENRFAQKDWANAERDYAAVRAPEDLRARADWKRAWCAFQAGDKAVAAQRFQAIAKVEGSPFREEARSMVALAQFEAGDGDAALRAADAYRVQHPQGVHLARTERIAARVLRQRGDLDGASQRLAAAAAAGQGEESAGDRLEAAELKFQQGDFRGAAAIYGELADRSDATGARALEGAAWCAFELGEDERCAELLAQGLARDSARAQWPALLELQSALHHRRQEWPAAIAVGERFGREFGDHGHARAMQFSLGVAQARAGQHQPAKQTLAAVAAAGGYERMDRVHYELAWACRRSGDETGALQAFAAAAQQSRDEDLAGECLLHLGVAAEERSERDLARAALQQVKGKYRARALYRLGFLDFSAVATDPAALQRAREAFATIAALPDEPLAAEAGYMVGECCLRAGDHAAAADRFRGLLRAAPAHERAPMARLLLGECAVQLGKGEEARTVLEELVQAPAGKDGPMADQASAARAHLALGRARQLCGEHDRAEQAFVRVTELSEGPLAAEAQFRIGESRTARSDLNGAADAFVKLPILYAHEEWVRKGLLQAGRTYERLNQPQKARRFYEELQQRFPQAPETKEAAARLRGI